MAEPALQEAGQDTQAPPSEDIGAIYVRLSTLSLQALSHADGIRSALGQHRVHMEHLLVGLMQQEDGAARMLLQEVGIDEDSIPAVLSEVKGSSVPPSQWAIVSRWDIVKKRQYKPTELSTPPPISKHVHEALVCASQATGTSLPIGSQHLLFGMLSVEHCNLMRALLNRGVRKEDFELGAESPARLLYLAVIAGGVSDDASGEDRLDIKRDVNTLCSVLAARDVEPPFAVGLFGDWGSGKSFFMKEMERRIDALQARARQHRDSTAYCTSIVQLKFNAWTYSDTDLWSNLAGAIFDGLASALVTPKESDKKSEQEYKRACLLTDIAKSKEELAEVERKACQAEAELTASKTRLAEFQTSEATIESHLPVKTLLLEAGRVAITQPEVVQTINAAKETFVNEVDKAATQLNRPITDELRAEVADLRGLSGTIRMLRLELQNPKGRQTLIAATLGLIVAALLIVGSSLARQPLLALLSPVVGVIVGLAPLIKVAREVVVRVERARAKVASDLEAEQDRRRIELRKEYEEKLNTAAKERANLQEKRQQIQTKQEELTNLRADRQMAAFIKQRKESHDYTKYQGVIAQVRSDFQVLTNLLDKQREAGVRAPDEGQPDSEKTLLPSIDRIILYIDDLDRCEEDKVVRVLQAVHLMLAFRLFIVVVGVDSRWLLHSLRQHSRAFQQDPEEADGMSEEERLHWQSTPLNYLEKIFQIPFTLRPMETNGYRCLIDDLTRHKVSAVAVEQATLRAPQESPAVGIGDRPDTASPEVSSETSPSGSSGEISPSLLPSAEPPSPGTQAEEDIDPKPDYLLIREKERDCMKLLFPLIPSPRAAKRFVNVYRLIRAGVTRTERSAFLGDAAWGGYRAALLLLAMLVGYPAETTEIIRDLLDEPPSTNWWTFVDTYKSKHHAEHSTAAMNPSGPGHSETEAEAERWSQLLKDLNTIRFLASPQNVPLVVSEHQSCQDFQQWAPRVARYSFQAGRVLLQQRADAGIGLAGD